MLKEKGDVMSIEELLKNLTSKGCTIIISPSLHGDGFDLQINDRNDEMVYHEPLCASVQPGLLEMYLQLAN
jgi:rRNA pseudouridine-1189 N-methylase Emg1 (Nep1/Mra1 family)